MKDRAPSWRVLARRLVYANPPWIRFENEDVELPDGRRIENYHVVTIRPHAMVFAVTTGREVLALRSYRRAMDAMDTSLPAGYIEEGEDPLHGAQRELLEETGHEADRWTGLGSYVVEGNYGCGRAHIFLAEAARAIREPESGDLEEHTLLRIPLDDVLAGRALHDVGTVSAAAAVGLAAAHLLRRGNPSG